jgi:transcriptional regulator with XRE-family HTH domain
MNLKQERKRARLSQGRLAKLAGVDASLISLLERGLRPRVSHDAAVRIARALNVGAEELFPVPDATDDGVSSAVNP